MCKIYNSVGSLTAVKKHLKQHNINDFNSLSEVINFQNTFLTLKQEIISNHEQVIENEKIALELEILQLDKKIKASKIYFEDYFYNEIEELTQKLNSLSTYKGLNFIQRFVNFMNQWSLKKRLRDLKLNFNDKINQSVMELVEQHQFKVNRYQYINTQFRDAVEKSSLIEIDKIELKQRIISEVKNSIYGALGEHKVVRELENLSNDNILINDFALSFHPAIYNRQEHDYIKSIQIDHLLITPSGIFIIETKNWSDKSLINLDLRSPIQQIKRTSFALFYILTNHVSKHRIKLEHHHWGERRIPIKNVIVMTNSKPNEDFQYVKVLTLSEVLGYIKYFKPVFSTSETQAIADYLLDLNK